MKGLGGTTVGDESRLTISTRPNQHVAKIVLGDEATFQDADALVRSVASIQGYTAEQNPQNGTIKIHREDDDAE